MLWVARRLGALTEHAVGPAPEREGERFNPHRCVVGVCAQGEVGCADDPRRHVFAFEDGGDLWLALDIHAPILCLFGITRGRR